MRSTLSTRSGRSTRSTRSQSTVTVETLPLDIDNTTEVDQSPEIVSTNNQTENHIDQDMSSSSDEVSRTGRKGKGKSALRPRPSKFATRASNASMKSPSVLQNKTAALLPPFNEPEAMSIDSPPNDSASSDKQTENTTEDSEDDDGNNTETREPSLPSRLQDAASNGDVWHCPVDGCMHKTYAASEPGSQILIKKHSQTHDFDHDERVQLVRRMEAPYLPVNRLMDKVRGMAASSQLPPRITQRY